MCAKDADDTGEAETASVFARVQPETKRKLEEYMEARGLSQRAALEQIIHIVTDSADLGETVQEMDAKLERVLQELEAPGVGAPVEDAGVVADGATRARTDYDALQWWHSVELSRDEADFAEPGVVSQTPRHRIPVMRGILLEESTPRLSESELRAELMEVFECTPQTAGNYVETGTFKSWYPAPMYRLNRGEEFERLKERIAEEGDTAAQGLESMAELFPEQVERVEEGMAEVWESQPEYILTEQLNDALLRRAIQRVRLFMQQHAPRSFKGAHVLALLLHLRVEEGELSEEGREERERELSEVDGVHVAQRGWWE